MNSPSNLLKTMAAVLAVDAISAPGAAASRVLESKPA
jgi:hypothetical protein